MGKWIQISHSDEFHRARFQIPLFDKIAAYQERFYMLGFASRVPSKIHHIVKR